MKAHECKMRVLCKWTKPNETRGKTYERKGSEFCNWAFIKMDLKIFLRTYRKHEPRSKNPRSLKT